MALWIFTHLNKPGVNNPQIETQDYSRTPETSSCTSHIPRISFSLWFCIVLLCCHCRCFCFSSFFRFNLREVESCL